MNYQEFQAPNLDGVSLEEMSKWTHIFGMLYDYTNLKRDAMEYRLEGDIASAIEAENACEARYQRLPKEVRW